MDVIIINIDVGGQKSGALQRFAIKSTFMPKRKIMKQDFTSQVIHGHIKCNFQSINTRKELN